MIIKNNYSWTVVLLFLLPSFLFSQQYKYQAEIKKVKKTSYHKITLSPELLGKLRENQTDIRIYDTLQNIEIPYFSEQEESIEYSSLFHEYKILKKDYRRHGISYLTFHNPKKKAIDNVSFIVKNTDVRKRARLSGSDDGVNWYVIKNNYLLHSMQSSTETTELKILDFPLSDYRYFRLEIDDYWRLPINILKVGYYDYKSIEGKKYKFSCPIISVIDSAKTTFVQVKFPEPIYLEYLSFKLSGADFYLRNTQIYLEDIDYNYLPTISSFELNSNSNNEIYLGGRVVRGFRIDIKNKDDQPLKVDNIKASYLKKYLIAKLNKKKNYVLKFGDHYAITPEYDLINFKHTLPSRIPHIQHSRINLIKKPIPKEQKVSDFIKDGENVKPMVITPVAIQQKDKQVSPPIFENPIVIWTTIILVGLILLLVSVKMVKELNEKKTN